MSRSPLVVCSLVLVAVAASSAQFLQPLIGSGDPSLALQPPPLQQAQFTSFAAPPPQISSFQSLPVSAPASQAFLQPSQPVALMMSRPLAHHAVVRNSEDESRLPDELRNNFYKNPGIAESLAKASWFIPGEEQVVDREAEKIPRDRIFKLLKNAGLARRR